MKYILASLIASLFAYHCQAQTSLTLEQFLNQAMAQNLGLKIEQEQFDIGEATESAKFKKLLPAISLTSSGSKKLQDTNDNSLEVSGYASGLSIEQSLYQPALWHDWQKSQLNLQQSNYKLLREIQTLLFKVKSAWYNLLTEKQLIDAAKDSLSRLKQHKKNAEAFYDTGKIWRNDLLQANVRVARGEQEVFAANNRLKLAASQVNLILNRELQHSFIAVGSLETTTFKDNINYYNQKALANRLDLKQAKLDINLAISDRASIDAKRKPTVKLKINTGVTSSEFAYQDTVTQTNASINLTWNFWQWGQTNQELNAAESKVKVQRLSFEQQQSMVLSEVQVTFLTVKEAQFTLKVSEQALAQSEENYRVSEIRYKEQLGSSSDVLDAQDLLTQTKKDRLLALSRYLTAVAQLEYVTGSSSGM
jgi:outer membrane protein TolC